MEYNYQQYINQITKETTSGIKRMPDNLFIPNDPANTDWQTYQSWLTQGNTPLPPEE